jgi:phospholipid/cholesterol/gamma-HCH transport system ATP-binding protein
VESIPELEIRGLSSVRGGYETLRDVSLELERGETLFCMGNAGSGKSTLLKTAAGICVPAGGEVLFRGTPLSRMGKREEEAFRKASGFAFQDAALWANQSIYENLALPIRLHESGWSEAEIERAAQKATELVGWKGNTRERPAELSLGERKLVGIARALILDPELIFMDEPTWGIDESSATRVSEILLGLKARGRSIIVSSAASDLVSSCADTVAVLINGVLAARGPYSAAVAWDEDRLRAVTGRLKPRETAPEWATGLAGDWAAAIAADADEGSRKKRGKE